MQKTVNLTYYGWSSFVLESSGGKLAFDPIFRNLFGGTWSRLENYENIDAVCVTHGHYDHYVDVPNILRHTGAVGVSSAHVCNHLKKKYGIPAEQLRSIKPNELVNVGSFRITAFEWGHREISYKKFFKEGLLRAQILPTLQFAWLNFMGSPFTAPFFGYLVECPEGLKVMNYCEGFSDAMDQRALRDLSERFHPDVVLAGAQLNFQDYLSKGVGILAPKKVFLFHPHSAMFSKLGLPSTPLEKFAEQTRNENSNTEVIVCEPGKTYSID